ADRSSTRTALPARASTVASALPAIPPPMMTTSNVSRARGIRSRAQFHDLCLSFFSPVRHPHLEIHRRRGGERLLSLLALACAPVELAEAEVAVGDEGNATPRRSRRSKPSFLLNPRPVALPTLTRQLLELRIPDGDGG